MREVIEPALRPQALALVREHQARGDTGGPRHRHQRLRHRARSRSAFGIDDADRRASSSAAPGGTITGRIARHADATARARSRASEQWLAAPGRDWGDFERISVYSDSPNDLPLLERATDPVATNPSPALEAIARERGWRILRLFAMIKKFIDKLLGKTPSAAPRRRAAGQARRGAAGRARHRPDAGRRARDQGRARR